jgi:hypothetical protein
MIIPLGSNQNEKILSNGNKILFSYSKPVAAFVVGEGYMRTYDSCSYTTISHINKWTENHVCAFVPQKRIDEILHVGS